jgi:hypothetical protein
MCNSLISNTAGFALSIRSDDSLAVPSCTSVSPIAETVKRKQHKLTTFYQGRSLLIFSDSNSNKSVHWSDMTENGSVHFNEKESKYKGSNNRHNFFYEL